MLNHRLTAFKSVSISLKTGIQERIFTSLLMYKITKLIDFLITIKQTCVSYCGINKCK